MNYSDTQSLSILNNSAIINCTEDNINGNEINRSALDGSVQTFRSDIHQNVRVTDFEKQRS